MIANLLFGLNVKNLPEVVVLWQRAQPVLHDGVADYVLQGGVKFIFDDRGLKYGKGCVTLSVLQDKYLKLSLFLMTGG